MYFLNHASSFQRTILQYDKIWLVPMTQCESGRARRSLCISRRWMRMEVHTLRMYSRRGLGQHLCSIAFSFSLRLLYLHLTSTQGCLFDRPDPAYIHPCPGSQVPARGLPPLPSSLSLGVGLSGFTQALLGPWSLRMADSPVWFGFCSGLSADSRVFLIWSGPV